MFYIGCDVSEKSSYMYVTDGKGSKVESQEIPTDKDGYRQYFKKWIGKHVKVAVEAGGHSRWIHDALKKMAISVYIVNPNKVKLIAKNKKKTDKVDAADPSLMELADLPPGWMAIRDSITKPWKRQPITSAAWELRRRVLNPKLSRPLPKAH